MVHPWCTASFNRLLLQLAQSKGSAGAEGFVCQHKSCTVFSVSNNRVNLIQSVSQLEQRDLCANIKNCTVFSVSNDLVNLIPDEESMKCLVNLIPDEE